MGVEAIVGSSLAASAIGSGIAGVAGLGSSLISDSSNRKIASENLAAQKEENALNRQFNAQEAEKSRQFVDQQRIAQQAYQSDEWTRQFNLQNEYNSPANQVKLLREGNLNPAVYFGGSGSVAHSSYSSVGAPSGGSSPQASFNQGVSPMPYTSSLPAFVGNIGDLVKNLAEGSLAASKTKTEDLVRNPQYRLLMEQVLGQELTNKALKIENAFNQKHFSNELKKDAKELVIMSAKATNMALEGKSLQAEIEFKKVYTKVQSALAEKTDTESLILKNELEGFWSLFNAKLDNIRSSSAANRASAAESYAGAEEKRSSASLNNYELSMRQAMEAGNLSMFQDQLEKSYNERLISASQAQAAESAAKQAKVAADHAEANFWKDFVLDLVSGGVEAFTSVRNSKSWANMSDASQRRVDQKLQEMQKKYGDKMEVQDIWNGKKRTRTYHTSRSQYDE